MADNMEFEVMFKVIGRRLNIADDQILASTMELARLDIELAQLAAQRNAVYDEVIRLYKETTVLRAAYTAYYDTTQEFKANEHHDAVQVLVARGQYEYQKTTTKLHDEVIEFGTTFGPYEEDSKERP